MFVRETYDVFGLGGDAGGVGYGGEKPGASETFAYPGCEYPLWSGEEARLLVEFADRAVGEALSWDEPAGRRFPGTGARALEQEHAAVRKDGQDTGDEVSFHAPSLPIESTRQIRAQFDGSGLRIFGVEDSADDGEAGRPGSSDFPRGLQRHAADGKPGYR